MSSLGLSSHRIAPFAALCVAACGGGGPAIEESDDGFVPEAVLEALTPDTVRTVPIAPGLWYHYLWSRQGPFAIHLAEMDLGRCALSLDVAAAPRDGGEGAHETVSAIAAAHPRPGRVAVNGDFFTPEGWPVGPEVLRGDPLRGRSRPALAWRDGGATHIGTFGVEDGVVGDVGWPTGPGRAEVDVIGGFPELLDAGSRVGDLGVSSNPSFAASRHPRTAVGVDPAAGRLWLVVVDGRQGAYSTGMTLPELAALFEELGATEALNLDGGGSSVMVVDGRITSRPSDPEGERPVANALLVVEDTSACR